jgi:hypothetical protein
MKMLTTSVYTFENLIEGNFQYVDKTAYVCELLKPAFAQYFLSRPRRFGKSLLISTLRAVFEGKQELFAGTHIANTDYDWPVHPVIHLDLGACGVRTAADLERTLGYLINSAAKHLDVELTCEGAAMRFQELIQSLGSRGQRAVVLIDEYDKPILGNADNPEHLPEILCTLKAFYSVIKTTESKQRFALLTGVSKFSKVSIFSDLNNLTDITMGARFATLLGYTQEELLANFADYIDKIVAEGTLDRDALLDKIRDWYNGYRFHERAAKVYNPVSVTSLFMSGEFRNYWFATGTPSMLINMLKQRAMPLEEVDGMELPEIAFSAYEIDNIRVEPLLFQTGYLTITDYDPEGDLYTLGYPNREIRDAFIQYLADAFTPVRKEYAQAEAYQMVKALRAGDIDGFMNRLKPFFAGIDYDLHISQEKYYQTVFYLILKLLGIYLRTEVKTNVGRIDAVVELADRIFIFEFKLHGTAQAALDQIHDRQYYERFLPGGKPIHLIGANFDTQARNISEWLTVEAPSQ